MRKDISACAADYMRRLPSKPFSPHTLRTIFGRIIAQASKCIAACLLASAALMAQGASDKDALTLSGRVTDANGAGVVGATVVLRAQEAAGATARTTTTDAAGEFRFDGVRAGNYRVLASNAGFSAAAETASVTPGGARSLEIVLRPGAIVEQVTVTATRAETLTTDTPVPLSVVERAELERRSLSTVGDLFRMLPGTATTGEGAFQVRPRIRGLDSNRVLILVDGERLNNARTSTSNSGIEIGLVEVDQIERVEVARGSGSVLYGTDALAGTINLITRDTPRGESGFRFGGGFDGYFSSNETGRRGSAFITGTGRRFSFRLAQTLDRFAAYHSGAAPTAAGGSSSSDAATEVPNSQSHAGNTSFVGRLFFNDEQMLKTVYERRRGADIGVPAVAGVFTAYFPFSNRDKVSVRYEGQNLLPGLARLAASVYYQKQERNFTNLLVVPPAPGFPGQSTFSETVTDTRTAGYEVQANLLLGQRNVLTVGTSYFRDRNEDERFIERFTPNFRTVPPSLTRTEDRSRSVPDATFGDVAFFAQDEYEVNARLRFVGGVRVDRFDIGSERTAQFVLPPFFSTSQIEDLGLSGLDAGLNVKETAVSGDFGAVVKATGALSFRARVGRSFREPNLFERFFTDFGSVGGFVVGNPRLEPETGVNFDTGFNVRTRRTAFTFTYFNNTYRNFLASDIALDRNGAPITVRTTPTGTPIQVFQTVNFGRTRIQGVEAEFDTSFSLARAVFTPFGNLTYLRGEDLERDQPLNFITPLKVVAGLRAQDERDRLFGEYRARVVTGQDRLTSTFITQNGGTEPGFAVSDVRGGYNFRRERYRFAVNVGIENLFNRFYSEQFVLAPTRGRSLVFGTSLRFY